MIDFARIIATSGKGGDGAGSFTHIKGKRRGKADGGDGGRGGHVYFAATNDLNTLEPFRFIKEYKAKDGTIGASQRRTGGEGKDLVVKVPVGTLIKVTEVTKESEESKVGHRQPLTHLTHMQPLSLYDLVEPGQKVLIARGGEGGRGNSHLRDDYGRRPFGGEKGQAGEVVNLELELKLIADVGLIGLPNAGKSTLLAKLTSATPKIADYPFTTLEPNLGVMRVSRIPTIPLSHYPKNLTIADIPGLIEGASKGKGLGHVFLRHIERTKLLVHLIDVSAGGDLWQIYQKVRNELRNYSKELVKKKEIILLTKADLAEKPDMERAIKLFSSKRKTAIAVSAETGTNLKELIKEIIKKLG